MTEILTASEWRRMNDLPEAGSLPDTLDLSGERRQVTAVTLVLRGTIPKELFPNWSPRGAQGLWAIRNRKAEALRAEVRQAFYEAGRPYIIGPVTMHWTIYLPKGGRGHDRDNTIAALKQVTDQIVQCGVIEDDSPAILATPTVEYVSWRDHGCQPGIRCEITSAAISPGELEDG